MLENPCTPAIMAVKYIKIAIILVKNQEQTSGDETAKKIEQEDLGTTKEQQKAMVAGFFFFFSLLNLVLNSLFMTTFHDQIRLGVVSHLTHIVHT